jgi:uncharacterized delta-60 repeat protein
MRGSLLVTLTLWLAGAGVASAGQGDLDPAFGVGGKALVDLGAFETASAVALQPDGRIIVGGSTGTGNKGDGVVARILAPQGTLDPTYGAGSGWSRIDFGGLDLLNGVAQQSDGRIVATVTDYSASGVQSFVVRLLNPGGTLDPAFGAGAGFVRPALLPSEYFSRLVLQPDDRILVAGSGTGGPAAGMDMTVARLDGTGALDPSYGGGSGWSRLSFPVSDGGGLNNAGSAVALQPNGRIVVAGLSNAGLEGRSDFAVARLLNPQGTFDPSFGPAAAGRLRLEVGGDSGVSAVAVQPDGGIVLAGSTTLAGRDVAAMARLLPAGVPDQGFSDDGVLTISAGANESFGALAVEPNGKIIAAGSTKPANGTEDMLVMRFQPNGQPDTTFGNGGRVVVNLGGDESVSALALQPDGRIVLVGGTTAGSGDLAVVRLQGDQATLGAGSGGAGAGGGPSTGVPRCAGSPATIIGTAGPDRLKGTRKADVIVGLGGDDRVAGLAGDDVICGGPGDDFIAGGAGADRLLGQAGADRLLGGAGRDLLGGGAGPDRLQGGPGVDVLTGGPGKNVRSQQ